MGKAHPELHVDRPAIIFGGPYGNLEATHALLDEAARLGIPPGRIVCTGDVVAYGADPAASVDLVRAAGIHVVMGNCEESLASAAAMCREAPATGSPPLGSPMRIASWAPPHARGWRNCRGASIS
jgi:hypothetical protein